MKMENVSYRTMSNSELSKISEIDRREQIRVGYGVTYGKLISTTVNWDVASFSPEGRGEHTISRQIEFCRQHIQSGARAIGAFSGETLLGIVVLTPEVRPRIAQIAYLLVGHDNRRMGIGTQLIDMAESHARATGAEQIYVSATPSGSAVGLYMRFGYEPVEDPLLELYELEPDDIHMVKTLNS
jgi:ribosomal protein S18 acetylase RimI-like enzyme